MALVETHIAHIKNIFAQGVPSDDFRLSERHIYHVLTYNRARLIKQKADKTLFLGQSNYTMVNCIKLCEASLYECEHLPSYICGPKYMRSICKFPRLIDGRFGPLVYKVQTITGEEINKSNMNKVLVNKYSRTRKDIRSWFIFDDYLWVKDCDNIEVVSITAAFYDLMDLIKLKECLCEPTDCFDITKDDFPIDESILGELYALTLQDLGASLSVGQNDVENNAKTEAQQPLKTKRK